MKEFQINENEANQRLDKYLKKLLSQAPDSFVYKMLRKKNITLNGKKAAGGEKLSVGDEVKLFFSDETFLKFASPFFSKASQPGSGENPSGGSQTISGKNPCAGSRPSGLIQQKYPYIPLDIRYEDEDILIINKPSGMLSQKAAPGDISANEYMIGYLLRQGALAEEQLATFRPSICNRLDRNTSGLLVAGKSLKGLQEMAECFKERKVEKYYLCLIRGALHNPQEAKGWLSKDGEENQVRISSEEIPGSKYFKAVYTPLKRYTTKVHGPREENARKTECYTLLEVHLLTGRTHQIRADLASIGHPILGDGKYGDSRVNKWISRELQIHTQLLHACRMEFADGRKVEAPLGKDFQRAVDYLEEAEYQKA